MLSFCKALVLGEVQRRMLEKKLEDQEICFHKKLAELEKVSGVQSPSYVCNSCKGVGDSCLRYCLMNGECWYDYLGSEGKK